MTFQILCTQHGDRGTADRPEPCPDCVALLMEGGRMCDYGRMIGNAMPRTKPCKHPATKIAMKVVLGRAVTAGMHCDVHHSTLISRLDRRFDSIR